ncbi:unnamed protein product [Orchesella dallaii]|uniref:Phosphatidylinositol transfer protein N-terminal domain-containing protein n=1 Tax=Orchesella dallaii TaxID=48710 RepID=A0ABP1RIU6_9HEXA
MKQNFTIVIESLHLRSKGVQDSINELTSEKLKIREVVMIDIANDSVPNSDYKSSEDPSKVHSNKFGRGTVTRKWQEVDPVMTCYQLVTVDLKWIGIQSRVENFIQRADRRLFANFHRKQNQPRSVFVNCQEWYKYSKNWSSQFSQNGIKKTSVPFSCIKSTYDGWLTSSAKKAMVTLRSCIGFFDSSDALPDGCYRYLNRNSKIEAADQHVISDFDNDSKVDVCICNTNECNGAIRWSPWKCINNTLIIAIIISIRFNEA